MGICGLSGFWLTNSPHEVHDLDHLSFGKVSSTTASSSSNSCPGSNASAMLDMQKLAHFDVFLDHRGPDVKKTFVSHLDVALHRVGCNPFLDVESLV
jgi:hypothetical protein